MIGSYQILIERLKVGQEGKSLGAGGESRKIKCALRGVKIKSDKELPIGNELILIC
jgi:hypothetical protein